MSFQNPGPEKCPEGLLRELIIFSGLNKNRVPDMGENSLKIEKKVQEILGLCFFLNTSKNYKFSLYPFLTFISTRVLETHLGGLKAACIGPALSCPCTDLEGEGGRGAFK